VSGPGDRTDGIAVAVADAHRREWAYVLAATVRVARDIDLAEECVQDAYADALEAWARVGIPTNPGAWLTITAKRRALDALRRHANLRTKLPLLIEPDAVTAADAPDIPDDRLRLVFTCCHPALAIEAQVALTLRLVCGLSTGEIARAFLVSEATMAARVTRAKKKIAAASIAYRVPELHELPDRLHAVLTVAHLVFTTGHAAPSGDALVRADLVERAIDLMRMLRRLMPDEGEVRGLLALMLFHDARRMTRLRPDGRLSLLDEQDRTKWNKAAIDEGIALLMVALRGRRPGRFTLQAALAAVHAEAPSYAETDWPELLGLYDELLRVWPSPVVQLNRVVPLAEVRGLEHALSEVERLETDGRLAGYHYLPATKADLLRRMGRYDESAGAYRKALALAVNETERAFLTERLESVAATGTASVTGAFH
jgi:RNA polymerase sigma-70 factor, ECF subfamily